MAENNGPVVDPGAAIPPSAAGNHENSGARITALRQQADRLALDGSYQYAGRSAGAMHPDVTQMARTCHEVNRAYCESLGDRSQKPWHEAPADIQQSAKAGVLTFLASPQMTPEQQHAAWMRWKVENGWTWGPTKDVALKTHPNLQPYGDLPAWERVKDQLFQAVCRSFLPAQPMPVTEPAEPASARDK